MLSCCIARWTRTWKIFSRLSQVSPACTFTVSTRPFTVCCAPRNACITAFCAASSAPPWSLPPSRISSSNTLGAPACARASAPRPACQICWAE